MKVSLNQVKKLIDFELPPVDELVDKINQQLGGVEEVVNLADKYKDVLIVKVIECVKHPDADRLSVTKIDDGGISQSAERGEDGLIQVVCGAPNVHAGMFAAWLPPASIVPSSYNDPEPFVLSARKLRGVLSQGMMAASDELGFDNNHETIIEIDADGQHAAGVDIKPGASFAQAFGLNDTIIDIENKMFTHRPDLFGQIGAAREIAGIFGHKFISPEWYTDLPKYSDGNGLELEVFNDVTSKSPRFVTVAVKSVEVGPSPLWLQCALVAMGSKPINNIVDITNYMMLLTAQPTHAYDYDRLAGHELGVRMAKKGERAELLNGKSYDLDENDIVIADAAGVVGLAGIMGGGPSEVTSDTKNIVIEVATFDMYTLRKTSMKYGLFTDALMRFNKGQSPLQNDRIVAELLAMVTEIAGGEQASTVEDQRAESLDVALNTQSLNDEQLIKVDFINSRLGLDLSIDDVERLLGNVEFTSVRKGDAVGLVAPFWRTDIEVAEDIVEEVGRLYGFDKLPRELPRRSIRPASDNRTRSFKQGLREELVKSGANEILSYSFVHQKTIENALQDSSKAFQLSNAISPDIQYYRLSVLPSLLSIVHSNIKSGYDQFVLYEFGKAHHKDYFIDELPGERQSLAAVFASKNELDGASYFVARRYVDRLIDKVRPANVRYLPFEEYQGGDDVFFAQLVAPFDAKRSALVLSGDTLLGVVGEFRDQVLTKFKLPRSSAGFELMLEPLIDLATDESNYQPLSRYPSVSEDVSLKLSGTISYRDLTALVNTASDEKARAMDLEVHITPLAIYRPDNDQQNRTITYRISLTSHHKTLQSRDASKVVDYIVNRTGQKFQTERA